MNQFDTQRDKCALLRAPRALVGARAPAANDADARDPDLPDLSVVIPTCGRSQLLDRCLAAITQQQIDAARYEIIVVDDRPCAATRSVVSRWATRSPCRAVRYVPSVGPHGPAAARNLGWRAARADIVAFTDDDTQPDPLWLRGGLRAMKGNVDAVCGRIVMPLSRDPTDYERDASRLERSEFATANCFCRRRTLEALGGFDERFRLAWREDSDLHFRLLEAGAKIARAEDAVVVHPVRPAPWGASLGQQKKIMFDALLFKKHPRLYRQRIRATPRWDYYAIVAALALFAAGLAGLGTGLSMVSALAWAGLTGRLCRARLRGTSKAPLHVAEMIVTSMAIPPLAVFWRIAGGLRFRACLA